MQACGAEKSHRQGYGESAEPGWLALNSSRCVGADCVNRHNRFVPDVKEDGKGWCHMPVSQMSFFCSVDLHWIPEEAEITEQDHGRSSAIGAIPMRNEALR